MGHDVHGSTKIAAWALSLLMIGSMVPGGMLGPGAADSIQECEVFIVADDSEPSMDDDQLRIGQSYDFDIKIRHLLPEGATATINVYLPDAGGQVDSRKVTGAGEIAAYHVQVTESVPSDLGGDDTFGVSAVIETASDECLATEHDDEQYDIVPADRPPSIDGQTPSDSTPSATKGASPSFSVSASDPDGDALSYTWFHDFLDDTNDDGLTQFSSGSSSASKTFSTIGAHLIRVEVSDGATTVKEEWTVDVQRPNNDRSPSVDRVSPSSQELDVDAGEERTFEISASDPDGDIQRIEWRVDGSVPSEVPGSQRDLHDVGAPDPFSDSWTYTFPNGGQHTVKAVVQDGNQNTATLSWGTVVPDLVVKGLDWQPEKPAPDQKPEFQITIENQGQAPADTIEYNVQQDGQGIARPPTTSLSPGESHTSPWITSDKAFGTGDHQLTAVADPADKIQESDESNNAFTKALASAQLPDPTVALVEGPSSLTVGQPATFTFEATNEGGPADWQSLTVSFPGDPDSSDHPTVDQISVESNNGGQVIKKAAGETSDAANYGGEGVELDYPLVELFREDPSEPLRFTVEFTPQSSGDTALYYKSVMSRAGVFPAAPEHGTKDQQAEFVHQRTLDVEGGQSALSWSTTPPQEVDGDDSFEVTLTGFSPTRSEVCLRYRTAADTFSETVGCRTVSAGGLQETFALSTDRLNLGRGDLRSVFGELVPTEESQVLDATEKEIVKNPRSPITPTSFPFTDQQQLAPDFVADTGAEVEIKKERIANDRTKVKLVVREGGLDTLKGRGWSQILVLLDDSNARIIDAQASLDGGKPEEVHYAELATGLLGLVDLGISATLGQIMKSLAGDVLAEVGTTLAVSTLDWGLPPDFTTVDKARALRVDFRNEHLDSYDEYVEFSSYKLEIVVENQGPDDGKLPILLDLRGEAKFLPDHSITGGVGGTGAPTLYQQQINVPIEGVNQAEPKPAPKPGNEVPEPDLTASSGKSVGEPITIDASGSTDADDTLTYDWSSSKSSKVDGLPENPTEEPSVSVEVAEPGSYTFTVTVDDGQVQRTASTEVTVTPSKKDTSKRRATGDTVLNAPSNGAEISVDQREWSNSNGPDAIADQDPGTDLEFRGNPDTLRVFFDFREPARIAGTHIDIGGIGNGQDIREYTLSTRSEDGEGWTPQVTVSKSIAAGGDGEANHTFDEPFVADEVKLEITDYSAAGGCGSSCTGPLKEFQLLGTFADDSEEGPKDPELPSPEPVEAALTAPTTSQVGEPVTLDATASTGPGELDYSWALTEGDASAVDEMPGATPLEDVRLLEPGTYTFEVTVTDGSTSDTASATIDVSAPDADSDDVPDEQDNCPQTANPDQTDLDGDGIGDTCDSLDDRDTDGDGVVNGNDECPDEHGSPDNAGCEQENDPQPPELTAHLDAPATATVGESITLDASDSTGTGPATTYTWSVPSGNAHAVDEVPGDTATANVVMQEPGEYTFRVGIQGAELSDTAQTTIQVDPAQQPPSEDEPDEQPPARPALSAARTIEGPVQPGGTVQVSVDLQATGTVDAPAIDEDLPDGFEITEQSSEGHHRASEDQWIWLGIDENQTRTIDYTVRAPETAEIGSEPVIAGTASSPDAATVEIGGDQRLQIGQTVPQAVAGEDARIGLPEIQRAINWWAEDQPVPDTGGQTLDLAQTQRLINAWAEDQPVDQLELREGGSR